MSVVARRYYKRGMKSLTAGNPEVAAESLRSAIDVAPRFSSARVAYAVALARLGDTPRAAQTLRAGLGRKCTQISEAAMWATLGDVLTLGGDFHGALDAFGQAARHPAFVARAASGKARVHGKLGQYSEAISQLLLASEGGAR